MRTIIWIVSISLTIVVLYLLQQVIRKKVSERSDILKGEILRTTSDYLVNAPDQTLFLPSKLKEISGLSNSDLDSIFLAVEDERGVIYQVEKRDGSIAKEEKFGGNGDYEGIEMVGDSIYVVTSSGDIYCFDGQSEQSTRYKTHLNSSHDIEGLTFYPRINALLLACKGRDKEQGKHLRSIYAFDLQKKELGKEPLFVLDAEEIAKNLKRKKATPYFSPSGILVNDNEDIYILSSVAKALIVLDSAGKYKTGVNLDRALHLQPEGLLIDSNKNLLISNEGREGVAKVYVFKPKPK